MKYESISHCLQRINACLKTYCMLLEVLDMTFSDQHRELSGHLSNINQHNMNTYTVQILYYQYTDLDPTDGSD